MTDKQVADAVCRLLISIVAVIRKRYGLPEYKNITVKFEENQ